MALPHYSQDQTSKKGRQFEPVMNNLFEVTILPPAGVSGAPLLLQHVNTVSGLDAIDKEIAAVEQKYKFSTRSYAGMPESTAVDLTIQFSMNLNDSNQAYAFKTLKQWKDLSYQKETGVMGLKKDYTGTLVIVQFNRAGDIFRTLTFEDCFITGAVNLSGTLDYSDTAPATIDVAWRCDTFKEVLA